MSDSTAQYVTAVTTQLNNVPQQKQSKLQDAVMYDGAWDSSGTSFYLDDRGFTNPEEATQKGGRIEPRELQGYRRGGHFMADSDKFYEYAEDKVRMLIDPMNADVQSLGYGKERKKDYDIINNCLLGVTWSSSGTGQNQPLDTPNNLPASQIISDDNRDDLHDEEVAKIAATGPLHLTIGKLITASKMLDACEIDGSRYLAHDEFAMANLLASTPTTSQWYSDVKALVSGQISTFMGFAFKKFSSKGKLKILPTYTAAGSLAGSQYVAWIDEAVHYRERPITNVSIQKDITIEGHPTQVYYKRERAWARRYDEGVVRIDCTQARQLAV